LKTEAESIAVAVLPVLDRHACVRQTTPANLMSTAISHPALDVTAALAAFTATIQTIYLASSKSASVSERFLVLHKKKLARVAFQCLSTI